MGGLGFSCGTLGLQQQQQQQGCKGFPGGSEVKESACNARDLGSIPGLGRSPGEGNGKMLKLSG